jgi:broad specificity phosphatase PhoE
MTSTARLQREADASRVELADTLGQLRDGLAPAAFSSEAIALVKDSGLSLIKTLAEQARANPVPALLIGAGLTMLLTRTTGSDVMGVASSTLKSAAATGVDAARSAASATAAKASSAAATAAAAASSAASSVSGAVRDTASAVGDRVADTIGEVRHQASEGYGAMKDRVDSEIEAGRREMHDRRDQAADLAGTAQEKAASLAEQTRQSLSHLLQEQPILMAALGAAIGAALGAALPLSKAEQDMIGDAGARAVGAGRDALASAADVLKAEAGKADIGGKVGEIADKVVQSVTRDINQAVSGKTSQPA